jgi:hypothetical protein
VEVIFERVDRRRYRIGAARNGRHDVGADVVMHAAPGHAAVPHDLVHFIVEEQAGLQLGIYGQVAAGGDVGGFFRRGIGSRKSVRDARRSRRLGRAGRRDVAESERLAGPVGDDGRIATAVEIDERLRARIQGRLDELLTRWNATANGGRLILTWPDELTIRHGVLPSR